MTTEAARGDRRRDPPAAGPDRARRARRPRRRCGAAGCSPRTGWPRSAPTRPSPPRSATRPWDQYVGRRLGREIVDRLVDPLLGGVYAGRADGLSLRATMPALAAALDRDGGKLISRGRARSSTPPRRTPAPCSPRWTAGWACCPRRWPGASGAEVRLRLPVRRIERTSGGFRLVGGPVPDPVMIAADAVVVAAPAGKAAGLLEGLAPWAAHELAAMEYASVAIVTLAFPAAALPADRLRPAGADPGGRRRGQGGDVLVPQVAAPGRPRRRRRAGLGRPAPARRGCCTATTPSWSRLVLGQLAALAGIRPAAGGAPGHPLGRRAAAVRAGSPGAGPPDPGRRGPGAGPGGLRRRFDGVGIPACIRSGVRRRRARSSSTCENRGVAADGKQARELNE